MTMWMAVRNLPAMTTWIAVPTARVVRALIEDRVAPAAVDPRPTVLSDHAGIVNAAARTSQLQTNLTKTRISGFVGNRRLA
jgi:hypothetical protein